jgi:hypothetical protein
MARILSPNLLHAFMDFPPWSILRNASIFPSRIAWTTFKSYASKASWLGFSHVVDDDDNESDILLIIRRPCSEAPNKLYRNLTGLGSTGVFTGADVLVVLLLVVVAVLDDDNDGDEDGDVLAVFFITAEPAVERAACGLFRS